MSITRVQHDAFPSPVDSVALDIDMLHSFGDEIKRLHPGQQLVLFPTMYCKTIPLPIRNPLKSHTFNKRVFDIKQQVRSAAFKKAPPTQHYTSTTNGIKPASLSTTITKGTSSVTYSLKHTPTPAITSRIKRTAIRSSLHNTIRYDRTCKQCKLPMLKKKNEDVGVMRFWCEQCQRWENQVCEKVACRHVEYIKNKITGMYECPTCDGVGGVYDETIIRAHTQKMTAIDIDNVRRCAVPVVVCKNSTCSPNSIVENAVEGIIVCDDCGGVISTMVYDTKPARQFDDDRESEVYALKTQRDNNSMKASYQSTLKRMQENREDSDLRTFIRKLHIHCISSAFVLPQSLIDEAAALLFLYHSHVTGDLLKLHNVDALYAAVIYIVTRNTHTYREAYDPLRLVQLFMRGLRGNALVTENVRITEFSNEAADIVMVLGGALPLAYQQQPPENLFWRFVQLKLEQFLINTSFCVSPERQKKMIMAMTLIQRNNDKRIIAEVHRPKYVAAGIYFHCAIGTVCVNSGNKFVQETAVVLCDVCKITVNLVRSQLFGVGNEVSPARKSLCKIEQQHNDDDDEFQRILAKGRQQ